MPGGQLDGWQTIHNAVVCRRPGAADERPRPAACTKASRGWVPARPPGRSHAPKRRPFGERLFALYALIIGPLLGWYMLFDRAGAYVHIPGTPFYLGECVLTVAIMATIFSTGYVRISIRDEPLLFLLGVFMLWGLARAVPEVSKFGVETVRDSALWYYAALRDLHREREPRADPDVVLASSGSTPASSRGCWYGFRWH